MSSLCPTATPSPPMNPWIWCGSARAALSGELAPVTEGLSEMLPDDEKRETPPRSASTTLPQSPRPANPTKAPPRRRFPGTGAFHFLFVHTGHIHCHRLPGGHSDDRRCPAPPHPGSHTLRALRSRRPRWLMSRKIQGQGKLVLRRFGDAVTAETIGGLALAIEGVETIDELSQLEASAAALYFGAWSGRADCS